jgi:hypothetical protein
MSNAPQLVQKLWNSCDILRDGGLSYRDYVDRRSFAGNRRKCPRGSFGRASCPKTAMNWSRMLGVIFRK